MKGVFIGAVEFSFNTFLKVLELQDVEIVGVVTRRQSQFNADFHSLEPIAVYNAIPCFLVEGNDQSSMAAWIKLLAPDVIYCFGWSYLLGSEILAIPPLGVIGYHPAALPQNRGRHPIVWALALGLKETASTFFFMDEGADSGDIISQRFLPIEESDDAATLYEKLTVVAYDQIEQFTRELVSGSYNRVTQDHSLANTWRKRYKRDGEIDWRMSACVIHNLVRALTKPYVGAHCVHQGAEIKVWKTEIVPFNQANIEPGKVLKADDSQIVVRCGEDAIKLLAHGFATLPLSGSYL